MIKGNLFESKESLAHCVSADLKMGAGIALTFRKTFGQVDKLLKQNKKVGECAILQDGDRYLCYLITKERYWHKPTYETLKHALCDLKQICVDKNIKYIAMPQIGCGLDKLDWTRVYKMINEILTDINITIYYL